MPAELSAYERQRLKNIAENRKVLEQLGIFKPFKANNVFQKPVKRKRPTENTARKARKVEEVNIDDQGSNYALGRRKSRRLQGQTAPSKADVDEALNKAETDADADYKPKPVKRENSFGVIPGVEVGTHWYMRLDCSKDGIHRPTVAGIHGNEQEGCYSVALSGGYEDDLDLGECFTFTGEGGRDLKGTKANPKNLRTAPQSKDQTLTRGNMALSKNVENRRPVRVIRGFKLHSPFAPDEGYRYDGLYTVEKFWFTTGLSGHGVYKFALQRIKDQASPPWEIRDSEDGSESGYGGSQPDKKKEDNNNLSDTSSDRSSSIGSPAKELPLQDNLTKNNSETDAATQDATTTESGNDTKSEEDIEKDE
ncbi:uncharacterized protein [Amphiura filiformis]|uniref:uncharacterized protein n=1 Tax=Amphiura filiformis TaxID=82378 RepID=UPI003B21C68E